MGGTDKGSTPRQRELGSRIKRFRAELGMSQERLALEASVNRTYIASLESGERNPSLETLVRLATGLRVDACDLVQGLQDIDGRS